MSATWKRSPEAAAPTTESCPTSDAMSHTAWIRGNNLRYVHDVLLDEWSEKGIRANFSYALPERFSTG